MLAREGHEIGIHGWIHELNSVLPYEAERDLMFRAAETLEKITGERPVGLRTPSWDFSPGTLQIERELGLLYDSSRAANPAHTRRLLEKAVEPSLSDPPPTPPPPARRTSPPTSRSRG